MHNIKANFDKVLVLTKHFLQTIPHRYLRRIYLLNLQSIFSSFYFIIITLVFYNCIKKIS